MLKKATLVLAVLILSVSAVGTVLAEGYPWRNHRAPFDFLFGNHIDTHQQTSWLGNGLLKGHFYIRFTGDETEDGFPIANHGDCEMTGDCTVGWKLDGISMTAKYRGHVHGQHPTWCVRPISRR